MAYGDANGPSGPVPWEEFDYLEYLWRMRQLSEEWERLFFGFPDNPDDPYDPRAPRAETAKEEQECCGRALEETALEFAVYVARLRMGVAS